MKIKDLSPGLIAAALLLLAGCASMNKDECQLADWYAMGYQQGAQGRGTQAFSEYQQDCAAHKIQADFSAFKRGHEQGLNDFCTGERGHSLGQSGAGYNAQCPASRYPAFDDGYQRGLARYCSYDTGFRTGEAGQRLNRNCQDFADFGAGHAEGYARYSLLASIADIDQQLAETGELIAAEKALIADSEMLLVSKEATVDQRTQALVDIKLHREEISRLKKQLRSLGRQREELQYQLDGPEPHH